MGMKVARKKVRISGTSTTTPTTRVPLRLLQSLMLSNTDLHAKKTLSECCNSTSRKKLHSSSEDDETNIAQSICRYAYGRCHLLHSWFNGHGFSTIAELRGHNKHVTGMTVPRGSDKLYSGSKDGTLRTWNCHTGQCTGVTNLGAEVSSLISEGSWIFVGLPNVIMAWNTQTSSQFIVDGLKGRVLSMTVGKDTLFAGTEDGVISAWRGIDEDDSPFEPVASLVGHTKAVVCLTIGHNVLYSGSKDQSIKGWDLDTFECKMTLNGHTDVVTSLISWNYYLISGSSDQTIKAWDLWGTIEEGGSLEVIYSHHMENGVYGLRAMTDAQDMPILMCSSSDDNNSVHLYEFPSFAHRGQLFAKQGVPSIEIGPNGLFFTGDGTGLVKVWKWLEGPKVADA